MIKGTSKDGTLARIPREARKPISFRRKENEMMENSIDVGIKNYDVLSLEQIIPPEKEEENSFQGFWKMSFNGSYSKSRSGVGIIFKSVQSVIYHDDIGLEFPCTNNEVEYKALIQGMDLALQMKVENLVITSDSKLVINHINKKYKIKK